MSSQKSDSLPLEEKGQETVLPPSCIGELRQEPQPAAEPGQCSPIEAEDECERGSCDCKTRTGFLEILEDFLETMRDPELDMDMNELRVGLLSKQADELELDFERQGAAEYIEEAVEWRSQALALTPDGHEERAYQLGALGASLHRKFECLGNLADIDQAIQYLSQAFHLTPDGQPNRRYLLNNLGASYLARFERLDENSDLDKAIECNTQAARLTTDGHPDKPGLITNLGNAYLRRFERLGELADLDKAIKCQTEAVHLTPNGHPEKPDLLNNLGIPYKVRFERFGELIDVDKAIECHTEAVQLIPDGHPDKPRVLINLGSSHRGRFERLGELVDLDKGIECQTEAVQLTHAGHPDRPKWLNNLGNSCICRFERLGQLTDMDKAIQCHTEAVRITPDSHPDKIALLNNLGSSYSGQFERLGELADLQKAIECQTGAVQLIPDGHPDKPKLLNNLANSYMRRYERLGELTDLDKMIQCRAEAVQLLPDGHSDTPTLLSNLGSSYSGRFERLGELTDLDKAIQYHTQAMQLTPDGHPDKPRWLNNLGQSFMGRFKHLREHADVNKAIECQTQALQLTPDGHPDKPSMLDNLGILYDSRGKESSQLVDHECARLAFQQAAQLVLSRPETQLRSARNWARSCLLLGLSPQQAFERCMELVPRLIWLGTTISQRYSLLTSVSDLATEAASWAISAQSYDLAIEWLEEGRSILWNQILQLRTPFEDLSSVDPVLAQRLKRTASELEVAGSRQVPTNSSLTVLLDLEQEAQHHRHMAADWEKLLEEARSIPGFSSFMRPRKAAELKLAATDGPVVLINTHSTRCDALIVFPECDDIAHVELDHLSMGELIKAREQLEHLVGHRGDRAGGFKKAKPAPKAEEQFSFILAMLWSDVVKPVLDALACTSQLPVDELPHITWCTTGALSFLPLHAAGLYDNSEPNACDLVVSSYTPSLGALLTPKDLIPNQGSGVLGVGQEDAPGLSHLPHTARELAAIKEHTKTTRFQQLDGGNATVEAVLDAMSEHSWVHLACHATQNPEDPARSAFHLRDGPLTLEAVTKRTFRNKGLAFLSACQTATGDKKLPDESIHLAAGMLMAGYPSVIGTMWAIYDEDAPGVAGEVYAELLKDGNMDHRRSARALHKAVVSLREKVGSDAAKRWVPFIHIGV